MALGRLDLLWTLPVTLCASLIAAPVWGQATPGGVADPVVWVKADDPGTISVAWRDHSTQGRDVEAVGSWSVSPPDRAHNFNPFTNGFTRTRLFRDNSSFASNSLVIQSMASFAAFRRTRAIAGRLTGVGPDNPEWVEEPGLSVTSAGMLRWYKFLEGTDFLESSVVTPLNRSTVGSFTSNQGTKIVEVGVNGAFNSKTFAGNSAAKGPFLAIGYGSWNTSGAFPGDIMEVIWYRRTITSNERDRINSYLAIKYGTTLPSSYLSSAGTTIWNFAAASGFNQNIAGIGLDQSSGLHQKQANSINSGDQVIFSLGNTVAASNAANNGAFAVDRSFAMWGDNAGSTAYGTTTTIGGTTYNRMARTWRLQQSGTVPAVTVAYPYSGADNLFLIISDTANFTGTNTVVAMPTTQVIEGTTYRTTSAPISFPAGGNIFFTFATVPVDPLIVTNTNDSGAGSLRNAINFANSQTTSSTVRFEIPGTGPHDISLTSALPDLTANGLTIDGTSQSGTQCRDLWAGTRHNHSIRLIDNGAVAGFRLGGANQAVRGISFLAFGRGIHLLPSSTGATVQCNTIDGAGIGSGGVGVEVAGASALVGGLGTGEGNIFGRNRIGVQTNDGSTDTAIRGNFIGTTPEGNNFANGIGIGHATGSASWRDITYNLISLNTDGGIILPSGASITPSDSVIRIQRNRLGVNRLTTGIALNGGDAINLGSSSIGNVLIGGDSATETNVIVGTDDGIDITGASNVTIQGNAIRGGAHAIRLDAASHVLIGGSPTHTNRIGGSNLDAINLRNGTNNVTITSNLISSVTIGSTTYSLSGNGIAMNDVRAITIGDGTATGRNILPQVRRRGISAAGVISDLTINSNYLGVGLSGNNAVANGQLETADRKNAIAFDNGTYTNISILNNVMAGWEAALIKFTNSTATGITIQGNNIGVGSGGRNLAGGLTDNLVSFGGNPDNYSDVLIGGSGTGQGNLIANGRFSGIGLQSSGTNLQVIGNTIRNNRRNGITVSNATQAAILGNRIFANDLIGIDLGGDGVTANDAGDGDSGANDLLNFPQNIRAIVAGANQLGYSFSLDAPAAADGYRIEFFANAAADPTGFGEGERFLGHVDITHAGGAQSYTGTLATLQPVAIGDIISATTTRRTAGGSWDITSEFSAVVTADGVADLSVTMATTLFEPPAGQAFFVPGNDALLTTTVSNGGNGSTDSDSLFLAITIDPAHAFYNAVTPTLGGVIGFESGSPALTFSEATDLRFSSSAAAPASFAACTYTPTAGYDPQVRHVCLNPKGTLPSGAPQGQFTVRLRARIN